MSAQTPGTNFFTPYTSTVKVALTNESGNATLIRCTAGNLPTDAGYAIGCIAEATDSGVLYYNSGTVSVASFTAVNGGAAALVLSTALTDTGSPATTGNMLLLTASALTSGKALKVLNGNITNFTTGAALFYGDLSSATAGNGLVLTGSGAYAGTGLISLSATAMTSGSAIAVASAEAALTSGKYLNLGGVFTVSKFGATVIAGSAVGTAALTLTAGDVIVSAGSISVAATLAAGDTHIGIKSEVGTLNADNDLGSAAYFQSDVTGTQAGEFHYVSGSWANINSGTVGEGKYICAQDNGIFEDSGATITNAKLIYGMRMEAILGDTDALVFPFSTNNNNHAMTALFDTNNYSDFGTVTNNGAADGKLIPFCRDAGGVLKYIKMYDLA